MKFKELTLSLMYISISIFFLFLSVGIFSYIDASKKDFAYKSSILNTTNQTTELIKEMSYISSALLLEKMDLITEDISNEVIILSLENINSRSERLNLLLEGVSGVEIINE